MLLGPVSLIITVLYYLKCVVENVEGRRWCLYIHVVLFT